jgi:hypothetical protein
LTKIPLAYKLRKMIEKKEIEITNEQAAEYKKLFGDSDLFTSV